MRSLRTVIAAVAQLQAFASTWEAPSIPHPLLVLCWGHCKMCGWLSRTGLDQLNSQMFFMIETIWNSSMIRKDVLNPEGTCSLHVFHFVTQQHAHRFLYFFFFNSQVVSRSKKAFCIGDWFVELEGFGLLNRHFILQPPAGWGHLLCVLVPVQRWTRGLYPAPLEMALGHGGHSPLPGWTTVWYQSPWQIRS